MAKGQVTSKNKGSKGLPKKTTAIGKGGVNAAKPHTKRGGTDKDRVGGPS
jgi:hypothetical protein